MKINLNRIGYNKAFLKKWIFKKICYAGGCLNPMQDDRVRNVIQFHAFHLHYQLLSASRDDQLQHHVPGMMFRNKPLLGL